jgi:hypothetical protein
MMTFVYPFKKMMTFLLTPQMMTYAYTPYDDICLPH